MDRCRTKRETRSPKYDDYLIEHASGEFEAYRLPRCFSPKEVAAKLQHSLVFLRLRRGWQAFTSNETIYGPCWLLIDSDPQRDPIRVEDPQEYVLRVPQ